MKPNLHDLHKKTSTGFAILIVSDSRTFETDESGKSAKELILGENHQVVTYEIVKNGKLQILYALEKILHHPEIKVIVTSGGTGISNRDITIETVSELLDKRLDGFGELFRQLSYEEIGEATMLSRALGGVVNGKLVFCLPGSVNAISLALKRIILPGLGHALNEVQR